MSVSVSYLSPAGPRVLAHRGLATRHLENTAGAFRDAITAGASFVETDAHVTRDRVVVLWHDHDLRRFDGSTDVIANLDWSDLSHRTGHCGARMLSFAEALRDFPELRLNVDLKVEAALEPAIAAVSAAGAVNRVLLTSFNDARRLRAAQLLPGVATSPGSAAIVRIMLSRLWCGASDRWLAQWRRALADAVAVQVPERMYGIRIVSPAFIRAAHSLGVEVHVWTINDAQAMSRLLTWGVDGIVTDRADLALALLATRA